MHDDDLTRRLIDDLRRDCNAAQSTNIANLEIIKSKVAVVEIQIATFEKALLERVQRLEFIPVKMIVYALAGGALSTVLAALLAKVIMK